MLLIKGNIGDASELKFYPYFPVWEIAANFESIGYYIIINYQEDKHELLH